MSFPPASLSFYAKKATLLELFQEDEILNPNWKSRGNSEISRMDSGNPGLKHSARSNEQHSDDKEYVLQKES